MKYTRVLNIIAKDYNHEQPEIPRTEAFTKEIKRIIRQKINKNNKPWDIVNHHKGYCECGGFIVDKETNRHIYYSIGDYRYSFMGKPWYNSILIRTAKGSSDYHGGMNHYTTLDDFEKDVEKLFKIYK